MGPYWLLNALYRAVSCRVAEPPVAAETVEVGLGAAARLVALRPPPAPEDPQLG